MMKKVFSLLSILLVFILASVDTWAAAEPTTQARYISFTVSGTTLNIRWVNGNGAYRVVMIRQGSACVAPTDNTVETGQTTTPVAWGALPADAAATVNQRVAWNAGGAGNSVSITGLTAGQTYHVAVYEYNTGGGAPDPNYNVNTATGNPRSKLIPGTPSDPTTLAFGSRDNVSIGVTWAAGGANVDYYEIDLATDNTFATHPIADYTTADVGNITSFLFDGLTPATNYYWRLRAVFNGINGNWVNYGAPSPIATLANEPNSPTALGKDGACSTNTTTTSMNIFWTGGAGTTDNFMVFVRPGSAPTAEDPTDGNAYDGANADYSLAPNKFKTTGNMVYNSSGTTMTVSGLTVETDYYFNVYAYNGTGTEANNPPAAYTNTNNYNVTELVAGPIPTLAQEPAQNTTFALNGFTETTLSFQWSDADALVTDYLIVARQGSSTTWTPSDGCDYLGTPGPGPISWATVTTFGTSITGNYIGYRDANNLLINPEGIQFTGLTPGTQYSFTLYPMREVSVAGTDENWNTSSPITVTRYTLEDISCITGGPGNPTYTNVLETSLTVNWTAATNSCTDEQYIVIARQGGAPSANGGTPVDGTAYTANAAFGSGSQIGTGNYVVYIGSNLTETVTNLTSCTQYCFDVYAFRGNGLGSENYYTPIGGWGASCRYTLTSEPTVAPSNIFFTNLNTNSYTVNWTAGNGNKHIVVGKLASAPVGNPVDATTYTANSVFATAGTEFNGDANNGYVVFATTGTSINVTGLTADQNYFWTVWTYNECVGGAGTENYLSTSITASRKTLATPPSTCPSGLSVTAFTNNSLTLGWTSGADDGTYLLVARQGSAVDAMPPPTAGDVYYANSVYGTGGTAVGTGYGVYQGTGTSITVTGLSAATVYHFRLFNFKGVGGSENYVDCAITTSRTTLADPAPNCPTGIAFSSLQANQYTISWAAVTGAVGYAVVGRQGAYPSSQLIDGNDYSGPVGATYTGPNSVWGTATADFNGDPAYVVYHSTLTNVTVTNLSSCTDYYWDVYAYTGSGAATNYTGPCQANRKTLFSYPVPTPAVNYVQGAKTNNTLTIQFSTPAHPAPGWLATHVLVVAKEGAYSSASAVPQSGQGYTASSDWSVPASQIGGGNVVYIAASAASTLHTVNLTNLDPCKTYYFDIYTFGMCGSDNTTTNYATTAGNILQGTHTTLSNEPTAPSAVATPFTSLSAGSCSGTASWTYSWDNSGAADGYAVYIAPVPVTWPTFTDGTAESATANTNYSLAPLSSLGGTARLVYNGSGSSVTITNMPLQTNMSVLVIAYNGAGVCTNWNTTTVIDTRYTLDGQPDIPTVLMTPSCSPVTTMNIALTDGSPCAAEMYYVFMREGAAVPNYSANFVDGDAPTGYNLGTITGNNDWSAATAVTDGSGTKCVYAGVGGSPTFNVTNLNAGTQYYISIVAYNVNGVNNTSNNYNPTFVTSNAYTVASQPTNPSGLTITNRTPNSFDLTWTAGTGDKSIVVVKPAADFSAGPVCGTGYNNGSGTMNVFGNGAAFDGTGYVVYIGTGSSVTVTNLSSCTQYYVRVYTMNDGPNPGGVGAGYTNNYSPSYSGSSAYTLSPAPTVPPTALSFSTLGNTSYTLNWTGGNGTYHIVVGVQGSSYPTTAPVNGTTYPAVASPIAWGAAPVMSGSEVIVFNGVGTSVTITGLTPVTVYSFRVYTYNMCAGPISTTEHYLSTYTQNQRTTLANPPGGPVTGISFEHYLYNSYKIKWNAAPGPVSHYMVIGEQIAAPGFADMPQQGTTYSGNTDFAAAPSINPLNLTEKIVYVGTNTEVTVTGMSSNTLYSWMVIPLNNGGVNGAENYLTPGATATQSTMIAPPTVAPQISSINNITHNSFDINYTDGNGTGTLILIKASSEPNYGPSNGYGYGAIDGNGDYSASGNFNATYPGYNGTTYETDGSSLVRVLYDGASTGSSHTLTVTNLSPCTQYYVHIYSYNGSGSNNSYYLYPGPGALSGLQKGNGTTLAAEPTIAPSAAFISARTTTQFTTNWTAGNGANAIILYNTINSFTAPTDGTVYSVGNTIGTATVAYVGTNSSPQTINLPSTCTGYYVAVYTYNDCGGISPNYNPTNTVTTQTYTYAAEPTAQPTGLTFGTRTTTTIPASWTAAAGTPDGYVAFAKQGSYSGTVPTDGVQYTVGNTYGDAICVYSGAGTGPANITGTPDQAWYIIVYSYNGSTADCFNYYTPSPLAGNHTTLATEPTAQPINMTFSPVGNTSFTINWSAQAGSGLNYYVLLNSVNSFTDPTDGTTYTANSVWQNAGQQCVYNGSGTSVAITGLASGTTYYVQIYSFNGANYVGSEGSENYLLTAPLTGNQTTTSAPDHFAITAIATPIVSGTAFQVTVALHDASHNLTTWTSNISFDLYVVSSSSGSPTLASATGLVFNAGNTTQNYMITINTTSNLGATNVLLGFQNVVPVVNPPAPWPGTHHNSVGAVNVLATQPSQASGVSFSNPQPTSITCNWTTSGGGNRVLVLVKQGTGPYTAADLPVDGTGYTANSNYTLSQVINGVAHVVLDASNTINTVNVTGMTSGTAYKFFVLAYNWDGSNDATKNYNTNPGASNNPRNTLLPRPGYPIAGDYYSDGEEGSISTFYTTPVTPNPVNENMRFNIVVLDQDIPMTIKVYNALGQVVITDLENQILKSGVNEINIPTQNLTSGAYILSVSSGNEIGIQSFNVVK